VDLALADKHLDVTLNILHFLYKRRFKRLRKPDQEANGDNAENNGEKSQKTDNTKNQEEGSKHGEVDDDPPLTEEELKQEAKLIREGDLTKMFKSFQSEGSGYDTP